MKFVNTTVLGFVLLASVLFAQEPAPEAAKPATNPSEATPEKPKQAEDKESPKNEAQEQPVRRARPGYGREAANDRRLASFVRLKELLFDKIKMSSEQRKKIESMFDDYLAGLIHSNYMPHNHPRPEDMATPQQLPELKKQLADAQAKGEDSETIAGIKAKIYAANIVLEPCVIDEPIFFLAYLSQELSEDQRKEFDPLLRRWQMLRLPEIAPDNDFKQLRRATRDPELRKDDEELGKQLDAMVLEALRTIKIGPDRTDKEVMKKLAAETRPKIVAKLNPQQRDHFEKTLALLRRWDKEEPDLVKKTREDLKDHRPAPASASEAGSAKP